MKISKISLSSLILKNLSFPRILLSLKIQSPPLHKWVKREAAMDTYLTQEYTI